MIHATLDNARVATASCPGVCVPLRNMGHRSATLPCLAQSYTFVRSRAGIEMHFSYLPVETQLLIG